MLTSIFYDCLSVALSAVRIADGGCGDPTVAPVDVGFRFPRVIVTRRVPIGRVTPPQETRTALASSGGRSSMPFSERPLDPFRTVVTGRNRVRPVAWTVVAFIVVPTSARAGQHEHLRRLAVVVLRR